MRERNFYHNLRARIFVRVILAFGIPSLLIGAGFAQAPTLEDGTIWTQTASDSGGLVTATFNLTADIPFFMTSNKRYIYPAPGSQLFAKATFPEYPAGRKGTATISFAGKDYTAASGEEVELNVPTDGYTTMGAIKVLYPAGEFGTPKKSYPELVIWSPWFKTGFMRVLVQYRDAFGKIEVLPEVNGTYPGFSPALLVHNLTTDKDLTRLSFTIPLKRAHELADAPSYVRPAAGAEARVTLTADYDQTSPVLTGSWATAGADGVAVSDIGGGGAPIELPVCRAPSPYIRLQVVAPNYTYATKKFLLSKTERVQTLNFVVTDLDNRPIKDATINVLSGGPFTFISSNPTTDASGKCTIKVRAEGDARTVSAHMIPKVYMGTCRLTQIIDDPGVIFPGRPAFINVPISIDTAAATYNKRDRSLAAGKVALKLIGSGNTQVGADYKCDEIYRGDTLLDMDRSFGKDRVFMPLPNPIAPGNYSIQAWVDDGDTDVVDKQVMIGSYAYFAVRDYWFNVAKRDRPLHFQYVAVAAAGLPVPSTSLPEHIDYFKRLFPDIVTFSTGAPMRPSSPFWAKDVARVTSLMSDLEKYRASTPGLDLVIGIVPSGGLDTILKGKASGLSVSGYANVVLIDPSRSLGYHSLHEVLHTRGLEDDYGSNGVPPPSAPGYDDVKKTRIQNWTTLVGYPQTQALMYDFANAPWPTSSEWSRMIAFAAKPAATPQTMNLAAAATQKVMSITGSIRCLNPEAYSNYKYEIVHDPIFTDWGEPDMPQGQTSPVGGIQNYMMGGVETISTSGASLGKAWRSLGMVFSNGTQQLDGYITTLHFMAPWSDSLKEIRLGYLPYAQPDKPITAIKTLTISANAPKVSWTSAPAAGSALKGVVTLGFNASDADGNKLYAWLKYSTDGGATWRPAAGWFTAVSGANQTTFNCAHYPTGSSYRFKLLVSDGIRTAAVETGACSLTGYSPVGVAKLGATSYAAASNPGVPMTITLPVQNTGRDELVVSLDPASVIPWLNANDKIREWRIAPGIQEILFWRTAPLAAGTYSSTFKLKTNNPSTPSINFPVTLTINSIAHAPAVGAIATQPRLIPGTPMMLGKNMGFTVYEKTGLPGLDARITIEQVSPSKIVLDQAAMNDRGAGCFVCDWSVPTDSQGKQYAVQVAIRDPRTGLADSNGLLGQGGDPIVTVAPRANRAPVLTSPSYPDSTWPVVTRGGNELVFDYNVSDPDGDPLLLSVHDCSIPYYWDQAKRQVRITPAAVSAQLDTKLVIAVADPHGGIAQKEWNIRIFPWTADWQFERAIPVQQDGTPIPGSPFKLEARCYNSYQWGKGCRFEYRKLGSTTWQSSGLIAYTWDSTLKCLRAKWDWKTSGLTAGACYEVRYVGVNSEGKDAIDPPVQRFFMPGEGASVTRIEAPSTVEAGKTFTIRIHVKNASSYTWTRTSGHRVGAVHAADPFAKGKFVSLSELAQTPPGGTAIYEYLATAPATPGSYETRWQPYKGTAFYGGAASKTIVVAAPLPFPAAELRDYLLGKWTPDTTWLGKADLNADGKINVADLLQYYRLLGQME